MSGLTVELKSNPIKGLVSSKPLSSYEIQELQERAMLQIAKMKESNEHKERMDHFKTMYIAMRERNK